MSNKTILTLYFILVFFVSSKAQFHYNEYGELISFSYVEPKVEELKKNDKINSLVLPGYNNDSLFWVNNIENLVPSAENQNYIPNCGFSIDTTIQFFKEATRIKIKDGYLWLYKITSPTAFRLGIHYKNCKLTSNEYLSIHSNLFDFKDGAYTYHQPIVLLNATPKDVDNRGTECKNGAMKTLFGNTLYVEFFSPSTNVSSPNLILYDIVYGYPTSQRLTDAPNWIRERYPNIDFTNRFNN